MATKEKAVLLIDAQGDAVQQGNRMVNIPEGVTVLVLSKVGFCCTGGDGILGEKVAEELAMGTMTEDQAIEYLKTSEHKSKDLNPEFKRGSMVNNNFTINYPANDWAGIRLYNTDGNVVNVTKDFSSSFGKHMGRATDDGKPLCERKGRRKSTGVAGPPAIQLSDIFHVAETKGMNISTVIMVSCRRKPKFKKGEHFQGSTAGAGGGGAAAAAAGGGGAQEQERKEEQGGGRKKKRRKRTRRRKRRRTRRRKRRRTRRRKRRRTRRRKRRRTRRRRRRRSRH